MNTKLNRFLGTGMLLVVILANVLMLFAVYLYIFDGNVPISYNEEPVPVVVENGFVFAMVEFCRYSNVPYISYVSFIDDFMYNVPAEMIGGTSVGCGTIHRMWRIPSYLPNGMYYIEVKNEFKVNPLKTVIVTYRTEDFEIMR